MNNLVVSPVPHLHSGNSLQNIMLDHIIALIPATFFCNIFIQASCIKGCIYISFICSWLGSTTSKVDK